MKGTRFQPSSDLWVSDLKPTSARKGAKISGSDSMMATREAGTLNSTIITRFSVPTRRTSEMPTETWNSERRSRRGRGRSGVAASAKGRKREPSPIQVRMMLWLTRFMRTEPLRFDSGEERCAGAVRQALRLPAGLEPRSRHVLQSSAIYFAARTFGADGVTVMLTALLPASAAGATVIV